MARKNFLTIKTRIELEEYEKELQYLSEILNFGANNLIGKNWKEENLCKFSRGYSKKHFKEREKILPLYLPNRAKRMILELAGNALKGQYQANQIFNQIKENCLNLNCDFKEFEGVNLAYVATILRRIEEWNRYYWIGSVETQNIYKTSLDTDTFFDFQNIPELSKVVLPYYQDDGRMIRIDYNSTIVNIKLPEVNAINKKEWCWRVVNFTNHEELQEIVKTHKVVNPTIVLKRRKSGSFYYEMNIPYEVQSKKLKKKKRVLGIDLGIKKFATLTIVENYEHSRPVFIKNEVLGYLKRLREHQAIIQESLSRIKKTGDNKEFKHLHAHYRRVQRKFRAVNIQIAHEVSKFIVLYAEANNCDTIAFERLGGSIKGKHSKDLNWLISSWIRGKILDYTKYKAKIKGIRVWLVNPRYTSRVCSKCGAQGKTYKSSYLNKEIKRGGHFYCSNCGYSADRDYNAALNIARLCLEGAKNIKKASKVVTYTATTSLGTRSLKAYSELEKGVKHILDKSYIIAVSPIRYVTKGTKRSW